MDAGPSRAAAAGMRRRGRRRTSAQRSLPLLLAMAGATSAMPVVKYARRDSSASEQAATSADVDKEVAGDERVSTFTSAEKGKGKEKPEDVDEIVPVARRSSLSGRRSNAAPKLLRFNAQKAPFHSSEVGSLASRQPAAISVGIFQPEYPFRPSGRRKLREDDSHRRSRGTRNPSDDYSKLRAERVPYESLFNVPQDVLEGNILKHGWTRYMLDDDARFAVPDDARRPRGDSAMMMAKKMLGKKWYRWQPGQGYVLSRYKDFSTYKSGPGIALGQLLPPREHVYTSSLPLIPNDSKRDLVWMVFWWIALLSLMAAFMEIRSRLRKVRKGKRKERSDNGVPSIRLFDDGEAEEEEEDCSSSPVHTSAVQHFSVGMNAARQRTQARNFGEMCKAALFPNAMPSMSAMSWSVLGGGSGAVAMNGSTKGHVRDAAADDDDDQGPSYVLQDVAWPKKDLRAGGLALPTSFEQGSLSARTRSAEPRHMLNGTRAVSPQNGSRDDLLLSPSSQKRPPPRRAVTQAYVPRGHRQHSSGRSIFQTATSLFGGGSGGGGGGNNNSTTSAGTSGRFAPPFRRDS